MFSTIHLKASPTAGTKHTEFTPSPLTVFIGPNNSGKSLLLRELNNFCTGNRAATKLLENVQFLPIENIDREIQTIQTVPRIGEVRREGHISIGKRGTRNHVTREFITKVLTDPNGNYDNFCVLYTAYQTLYLDGVSRLSLVQPQSQGDLHDPANILCELFTDDDRRREARKLIYDAFGKYLCIDPTSGGQLVIRLSDIEPAPELERSLSQEAVEFHRSNPSILEMSDGVKAFTGFIINLIAGDPKVTMIDEPEAFLHPSLSSKLGRDIGSILSKDVSKRVFVATHSARFLMGCLQSGVPINIIRLTFANNTPTAKILSNEKVKTLMRNPLLRSVDALSGLFFEYVIVTEGDSDRAFYQEINERLLKYAPERGIPNCLFINAQNKQTIHQIMKPLREMGIPCAGIVDIDVIKEGGQNWTNLMEGAFVPPTTKRGTEEPRRILKEKVDTYDTDNGVRDAFKRSGGIAILEQPDQQAANDLFNQMGSYGIFVVRTGELESWLKPLEIQGEKSKWLISMFERLGEDSNDDSYIRPGEGDVWSFLENIRGWLTNPNRFGLPE